MCEASWSSVLSGLMAADLLLHSPTLMHHLEVSAALKEMKQLSTFLNAPK